VSALCPLYPRAEPSHRRVGGVEPGQDLRPVGASQHQHSAALCFSHCDAERVDLSGPTCDLVAVALVRDGDHRW
jgi:hypothetical protein